jgi:hypothetical protein
LSPNLFIAALIVQQGPLQLSEDVIRDVNVLEDLSQPIPKLLLPKIREPAFPPVSRAMVVGVTPPFDLRCHLAVVVGARQQTSISKFMGIVTGLIVTTKNRLDLLEASHRNKRSVSSGIQFSLPQELAFIKGIFEYPI